jgi:hypothetical protein
MERWWEESTQQQQDLFRQLLENNQIEFVHGGWTMAVRTKLFQTHIIRTKL